MAESSDSVAGNVVRSRVKPGVWFDLTERTSRQRCEKRKRKKPFTTARRKKNQQHITDTVLGFMQLKKEGKL